MAALTVLAAALRLYPLAFGYAHPLVDYDGGVYLGSALALVDGRLPYRDFVLVQPPGIALLLAPLAALAKAIGAAQVMGLARVATALAGAASVPLVARIVRHRGPAATLLACGLMALQTDALAASRTLLLEPWLVLCSLGAVALAFDGERFADPRRLGRAGVLLGFACTIKIWALVPAVVLVAVCLVPAAHRRAGLRCAGGVLLGLVPMLPFLVAAPSAFVHQVVADQLLRTATSRTSTAFRLVHVFASAPPDAGSTPAWGLLVALAAVVAALLVLAWVRRRPGTPLERFVAASGVLVVAMMLTPDTFYWHYAAFTTPFLVLAAVLRLPGRGSSAPASFARRPPVRRHLPAAALVACVLALALTTVLRDASPTRPYDNHRAIDALVPRGACLVSSTASASIAADRFGTGDDCPFVLDPFGEVLAATGGAAPSADAVRAARVSGLWLRAYEQADYVYLQPSVSPTYPTSGPAQHYLVTHFTAHPVPRGTVYERVTPRRP